MKNVTRSHCEGYYTCEINKDGKPYFSVYHCLRVTGKLATHTQATPSPYCCVLLTGSTSISDKDELLDEVRQATKELRSEWYSLAIEVGIDYGTRKVR